MPTTLGHGTTITFSTGFLANILSLQWSGVDRPIVPATTFGTTGGKAFEPADLVDAGELAVEIQHDTDTPPPIEGAAETVTITWPTSPATTHIFTGFMVGYDITAADEEKVTASARIKATGAITW